MLELPQVSAGVGVRTARILLRQVLKLGARLQLRHHIVRLGLRLIDLRLGRVVRRGDQDLAQTHLFRRLEVLLVRLVVDLLFLGCQPQIPRHLVTHYLLRDHVLLDLLLEVLHRHAGVAHRLVQRVHRVQVVFLANLIQPPDHLRVGVDLQFLAPRQQQLPVDHVAQQVLLAQL